MPGQVIASATSLGPIDEPGVSNPGAEGTQDGICTHTWIGCCAACHLVRVDEHASRAMRANGTHEFGHRHHAGLDVHVPIQQAGD
jgi:hypothetical protein